MASALLCCVCSLGAENCSRSQAPEPGDQIDSLRVHMSQKIVYYNWSRPCGLVPLPRSASMAQLLDHFFGKSIGFDAGHVTRYRIIRVRDVHIRRDPFKAVLAETDQGWIIVLLEWQVHEHPFGPDEPASFWCGNAFNAHPEPPLRTGCAAEPRWHFVPE